MYLRQACFRVTYAKQMPHPNSFSLPLFGILISPRIDFSQAILFFKINYPHERTGQCHMHERFNSSTNICWTLLLAKPIDPFFLPCFFYCYTRTQTVCFAYLHFVRRFWNQVFTCASVILSPRARAARSADARYFCLWNRFSSSATWMRVKEVRGFFRLGGVLFWYGWPIRRAMGKAVNER